MASGVVATKSLLIHPVDAKRARCFIPLMPQDSQPVRIWWHINQDQNTVIITFDENVMQIKSQKDATKAPFKKKKKKKLKIRQHEETGHSNSSAFLLMVTILLQ